MALTLPSLDDVIDVPLEVTEAFQANGHAVIRGLCSPEEIAAYRPALETAVLSDSRETRPLSERDTYSKAFLQVPNLWRRHEAARRFVCSPRFAKVAADLLRVDGVRLYHDQALFKEAGGGRTPWHQDQFYWPLDSDKTITMWMPLVDVPVEIGSMTFVSGSHRSGHLGEFGISDESDAAFASMIELEGFELETHGALAAGDATFHAGWMLHSAPPNPTGVLRSVMTVIWFADGAKVATPANPYQEYDRQKWLDGVEPGQVADSQKNPLLWPAIEREG